jgi:hypothetical protein
MRSSRGSWRTSTAGAPDLRRALSGIVLVASVGGCAPLARPPAEILDAPSQHLFRLEIVTADERVALRLTLRLWGSERFDLYAHDGLGRPTWAIQVAGEEGRWRESRGGRTCRFAAEERLRLPDLDLPLPAGVLPELLLGRLPVRDEFTGLSFTDREGNLWRAEATGGRLSSWSVHDESGVLLSWRRDDGRATLVVGETGPVFRWSESARERLRGTSSALPPGDELSDCRDAPLP